MFRKISPLSSELETKKLDYELGWSHLFFGEPLENRASCSLPARQRFVSALWRSSLAMRSANVYEP
jgi:hypothetical protein